MKKQDEHQRWLSDGLAKFSEILKEDRNGDIKQMTDNIISHLVKYLNVAQGGIFLIHEKEKERLFELMGAYAYERKKFLQTDINGERV